ncbi:MAG: acyl-CoA dehydrogenase family protein, partial [Planctomycetes bacterium]|nr:acyl-CoA dehydrogenase family protein [Planctomycetota bacterium]
MTDATTQRSPQVADFELSNELAAFRKTCRDFAERELRPNAALWDRETKFPADAVRKAAALGLLRVTTPRAYGGSELGNVASCVMLEEINRCCPSTGVTISVHNSLVSSPLAKWGNDEQKRRYFPKLVAGEWIG